MEYGVCVFVCVCYDIISIKQQISNVIAINLAMVDVSREYIFANTIIMANKSVFAFVGCAHPSYFRIAKFPLRLPNGCNMHNKSTLVNQFFICTAFYVDSCSVHCVSVTCFTVSFPHVVLSVLCWWFCFIKYMNYSIFNSDLCFMLPFEANKNWIISWFSLIVWPYFIFRLMNSRLQLFLIFYREIFLLL